MNRPNSRLASWGLILRRSCGPPIAPLFQLATVRERSRRSEFLGCPQELGEAGRGHCQPAASQPFGDMIPVGPRPIDLDPDPVGRAILGRAEVKIGLALDPLATLLLAA